VTPAPGGLSLRAKLWLSHGGALALGLIVSAFLSWRVRTGSDRLEPMLERTPLSDAATLAYQWGSTTDGASALRQYDALLRARPEPDALDSADIFFARLRLAIIEQRPRPELLRLCVEWPHCTPENFDRLVAKLVAERHVTSDNHNE
jgi:hypothetical protein